MLPSLAGIPTLVLVGDEDEAIPPAQSRAMADAIPGASLVVIRSAGHLPTLERPVETSDALLAFLQGLP
jgi:pimeloyl-ACP methyl ester carboxylesterase